LAGDVPDFVSVSVMENVCPTLSGAGVAAMLVAVTPAAATTGTKTDAGDAVCTVPVLVSTQVADAPMLIVCGVAGAVHPDQVRLRVAPIAFTGMIGGVVQVVPVSATAVTLAAGVPLLARAKVTVNP
jgi:hypothetical protein